MNNRASRKNFSIEVECFPGLEQFVAEEIRAVGGVPHQASKGAVRVSELSEASINQLRTARALYLVHEFSGRKPSALLGHENLTALLDTARAVISKWDKEDREAASLRLLAAGSQTNLMERIRETFVSELGLIEGEEAPSLCIRIRKSKERSDVWEVLVRTSPRPLGIRPWKKHDYRGALHPTIASALLQGALDGHVHHVCPQPLAR